MLIHEESLDPLRRELYTHAESPFYSGINAHKTPAGHFYPEATQLQSTGSGVIEISSMDKSKVQSPILQIPLHLKNSVLGAAALSL